jgi:anti-sigma regulatory factor (Ser/Thr protein kinase)
MSAQRIADLKTVVSEACGNAVRYAYENTDVAGRMEIDVERVDGQIDLSVRDRGTGVCPRPDSDLQGLGLGLPLIGALSQSFCLRSELGVGTELSVRIEIDGAR